MGSLGYVGIAFAPVYAYGLYFAYRAVDGSNERVSSNDFAFEGRDESGLGSTGCEDDFERASDLFDTVDMDGGWFVD